MHPSKTPSFLSVHGSQKTHRCWNLEVTHWKKMNYYPITPSWSLSFVKLNLCTANLPIRFLVVSYKRMLINGPVLKDIWRMPLASKPQLKPDTHALALSLSTRTQFKKSVQKKNWKIKLWKPPRMLTRRLRHWK